MSPGSGKTALYEYIRMKAVRHVGNSKRPIPEQMGSLAYLFSGIT